jgi:dTDP-4-dehydrorhamnose reductase
MKVAIVGANGQLGSDLCRAFAEAGAEVCALTHEHIEVTSLASVREALGQLRPQVIVNTAALHHVEQCEQEPERAFAVNALGPRNLAVAASEAGAVLVQISTDYVFDGARGSPYVEADVPLPLNVYGNTKLAGEYFVRSIVPRHFIVRTSALYGHAACRGKGGRNFVELMLKLGAERGSVRVVTDETVSPTWTRELARQVVALASTDAYGLYHATAEGCCTWYEFAREIFEQARLAVRVEPAAPGEFPQKTPRPKYSVLENQALKKLGLNLFRPWQQGLRDYLAARG